MNNLYGKLMIDIDGVNLSDEDKFLISNKHIGGLILFKSINPKHRMKVKILCYFDSISQKFLTEIQPSAT